MVDVNHQERTLKVKLVYYGPAVGGKTTNLKVLHENALGVRRGQFVSINSAQDRTILCDLLPLASWRSFHGELTAIYRRWAHWPQIRYLLLPLILVTLWLVARLVVGTALEIVGRLLLALAMLLVYVWQRFLGRGTDLLADVR